MQDDSVLLGNVLKTHSCPFFPPSNISQMGIFQCCLLLFCFVVVFDHRLLLQAVIGPSATEILDVIGELKVGLLSDEQLRDTSLVRKWFSGRLKGFLPSASGRFLHCLSERNLSCQSYQEM